jgi:predicted regulator of Ras-like GTPase activity (Roadblock/LC7/MglB family)
LNDLRTSVFSSGSAIITKGGLITASDTPPGVQPETFGAMCATVMGAAEVAVGEFKVPTPEQVIVQSKDAILVIISIDDKYSLAVMIKRKIDEKSFPDILSKISQATAKLKEVF